MPGCHILGTPSTLASLLPSSDLDVMFDPENEGPRPLVFMKSVEMVGGKRRNLLNALELCTIEETEKWQDTTLGNRPAGYAAYKRSKADAIKRRMFKVLPECEAGFRELATASMLTFRDYLNNPYGCAYGIKQKMGQWNVFGQLPIRRLYAAGQSASLPGIVGAMISSFIVARSLVGKNEYSEFITTQLDHD